MKALIGKLKPGAERELVVPAAAGGHRPELYPQVGYRGENGEAPHRSGPVIRKNSGRMNQESRKAGKSGGGRRWFVWFLISSFDRFLRCG
jgi:hypothetical protein